MNSESFSQRLSRRVVECRTPLIVGLDPRWANLPRPIQSQAGGDGPAAASSAFAAFCREIIDVVAPLVPAVKPQLAFFEQCGPAGMAALADVIAYAKERDLLVIADGKRNDIGSTARGYADAWLGAQSAFGGDALTVSPYLGDDSLDPFVAAAHERSAGLFVLVKTSNPGGSMLQDRQSDGESIYNVVARHVEQLSQAAGDAYGNVGAVVGATWPGQLAELRGVMPHCWFLVPGFGAQGGTAADVAPAFDERGLGAVVNSSRGIIFAHERPEYRDRFGDKRWQQAVEAATLDAIEQLRSDTPAGRLHDAT